MVNLWLVLAKRQGIRYSNRERELHVTDGVSRDTCVKHEEYGKPTVWAAAGVVRAVFTLLGDDFIK